jgi:hypothetical protein
MDIFPKIPATSTFSQIEITQAADPQILHIILEGEDDVDFLRGLFFRDSSLRDPKLNSPKWVNAYGRPNCMRVHELCVKRGTQGVLFVVDADFDRKLNSLKLSEAVAYTDRNDMECTVLAVDPILERVQEQYHNKTVVQELLDIAGHSSLFTLAVDRASQLGRYRFVDKRDKLSIRFKNPKPDIAPPYESFLSKDNSFSWDDIAFREWVTRRNPDKNESVCRLFEAVDRLPQPDDDKLDWCQGHDLISLHAVVHNRVIAQAGGEALDGRALEEFVRRNVEPSRVRAAEVIRRIEVFVGWELPVSSEPTLGM